MIVFTYASLSFSAGVSMSTNTNLCVRVWTCRIRANINRQASCSEMNERADFVEADEVA